MTVDVVVIGAGGFGRETLDVLHAVNRAAGANVYNVLGVLDSNPSPENLERLARMSVDWLGPEADWLASAPDAQYLIGVGKPSVRMSIWEKFNAAGMTAATVIHPDATVGSLALIGPGSIVCAGAQISSNVTLGAHVHVNPNATIGHDCLISDFVSINPGAIISGDVSIGGGTLIGAGAVVLQGISVGDAALVGASACVVRDVDQGVTVKGVPAR
jgi:sugar O-acyltransferase (sialic acid O-acetyltransferase NeuD family)